MAEYSPSKIIKDGNTYNFRDTTKIPLSGSNQISGSLIPATDNAYNLGDSTYGFASFYVNKLYLKGSTIFKLVDDSFICLGGATTQANGANLTLNGKNRSTSTGEFKLEARDGTNVKQLIGKPDGALSWSGTSIAPTSDNSCALGDISNRFNVINVLKISASANSSQELLLCSNDQWWNGSFITLKSSSGAGTFGIRAVKNNTPSNYQTAEGPILVGYPNGNLTWDGNPITYTSDYRIKDEIESIPDEILDAWENLEPKQYKYKSDLETDKENAQVHYGWIAQDVESIIKGARKGEVTSGLWIHEQWEEQAEVSHEETYTEKSQIKDGTTETVIKTRKVIDQPYKAKGDSYGLRYTECLVVECAYLRKKLKELTARIEQLEKGNNVK